jgi:hypothetical protein
MAAHWRTSCERTPHLSGDDELRWINATSGLPKCRRFANIAVDAVQAGDKRDVALGTISELAATSYELAPQDKLVRGEASTPLDSRYRGGSEAHTMKLIIVHRSKVATYTRLREQFADDPNVKVIFEQRKARQPNIDGSALERRHLAKSLDGRDYIVIHTADEDTHNKRKNNSQ